MSMSSIAPRELLIKDPFRSLFPINPAILEAIKESMQASGFDNSKPIDVWAGRRVVVDGHTRLRAAIEADISKVAIHEHDFIDEEAALDYAIGNQRRRRNLTDLEIACCLEALDKRKRAGRPAEKLAQPCAFVAAGKTSSETAKLLGISPRKVEQARTVLDHADEETKQAVLTGAKTINQAYIETQERRRGPGKEKKAEIEFGHTLRLAVDNYCNILLQRADKETIDQAERTVLEHVRLWWCEVNGVDISSLSPAKEEAQPRDLSREEVLVRISELRVELSGVNKRSKLVGSIVRRLNEEKVPTLNGIEKWNMGTYYTFIKEQLTPGVKEEAR